MRVFFTSAWARPVAPGMEQRFAAGWTGELPDPVAEEAVLAGAARKVEEPAPADAEDGA